MVNYWYNVITNLHAASVIVCGVAAILGGALGFIIMGIWHEPSRAHEVTLIKNCFFIAVAIAVIAFVIFVLTPGGN